MRSYTWKNCKEKGCTLGSLISSRRRNARKRGEIPKIEYVMGPEQAAMQAGLE